MGGYGANSRLLRAVKTCVEARQGLLRSDPTAIMAKEEEDAKGSKEMATKDVNEVIENSVNLFDSMKEGKGEGENTLMETKEMTKEMTKAHRKEKLTGERSSQER